MLGLDTARALYGGVLLLAPRSVLCALARVELDPASVRTARVLGARHLGQAAILHQRPDDRGRRLIGAAVDAAHAASMLGLARWSRRPLHRLLARRDARTAALLAVAGAARSLPRR